MNGRAFNFGMDGDRFDTDRGRTEYQENPVLLPSMARRQYHLGVCAIRKRHTRHGPVSGRVLRDLYMGMDGVGRLMPGKLQAFFWFGGKGGMVAKIVPILEKIPHRFYCEPFGGAASILLNKTPVDVETYNDLDSGVYGFFMVLSDPGLFEQFKRRVEPLPYSRELYNDCRATWRDEADPVKRAVAWYVVARMNFSGRWDAGWSMSVTYSTGGMAHTCSRWLSGIKNLPAIHARLQRVQIENADWRTILDRYDTPDTLFYLDPPYVTETRSGGNYAHEMTSDDHAELVEKLLAIQGKAALSGYPHDIYAPIEHAGWNRIDWQTACSAAGRTRATGIQGAGAATRMQGRTECLWIKPHESHMTLFDYEAE